MSYVGRKLERMEEKGGGIKKLEMQGRSRDVEVEAVKLLWKRKHFDERDWKRKRTRKQLILSRAGSGSKTFQRSGSGSELGSIKLQRELEVEALKI